MSVAGEIAIGMKPWFRLHRGRSLRSVGDWMLCETFFLSILCPVLCIPFLSIFIDTLHSHPACADRWIARLRHYDRIQLPMRCRDLVNSTSASPTFPLLFPPSIPLFISIRDPPVALYHVRRTILLLPNLLPVRHRPESLPL